MRQSGIVSGLLVLAAVVAAQIAGNPWQSGTGAASAGPAPAVAQAAGAPQGAEQPNLVAVKADFMPGDKVLLFDDFSDMVGDEPPPHWKVRGGTAELRVGKGVRQLTLATSNTTLTPNVKGLPKNFTMEADLMFENPGSTNAHWFFRRKDGFESMRLMSHIDSTDRTISVDLAVGDPTESSESVGKATVPVDLSQPIRQALWAQDGRLRVYINGQRVIDGNQIQFQDIVSVDFNIGLDDTANTAVGLRMARFAESAPDFSKVISASGRYVSHGILFDTDSDRIKPESAPVIKAIARSLETNPVLKLRIEGHTDAVGNAAHNLDLSKRRAEAVKAVLVAQFKVESERLTTAGLGDTKPIDTNDTPTGRAQNRRVEFVKQ